MTNSITFKGHGLSKSDSRITIAIFVSAAALLAAKLYLLWFWPW